MRIRGAKRVPLVGEDPQPPERDEPPRPAPPRQPLPAPPKEVPRGKRARKPKPGTGRATVRYVEENADPDSVIAKPHRRYVASELPANLKPQQRGGMHFLSSTNSFGLSSRAEEYYPELFRPISGQYWKPLSELEQLELIARQAAVQELVGYRDDAELLIAETAADAAYAEAQGRRNSIMRRRRSKKRGYEKKKEEEEWRRVAPLTRRYIEPQLRYRDSSAIVKTGPLDTPVLVTGLPRDDKQPDGLPQYQPPPKLLKPVKTRRQRRMEQRDTFDYTEADFTKPQLPQFATLGAPVVRVQSWKNKFGLTPRAITAYPEAYRDVSSVYWRQLSREQRDQIMQVQAVAMEKVGFERGTTKRFIEDFEPGAEDVYAALVHEMTREQPLGHKIAATIAGTIMSLIVTAIVLGIIALMGIAIWDWLLSFAGW